MIHSDTEFGIIIGNRAEIPTVLGRGRNAVVPQLTVAKKVIEILKAVKENGIGVSEEIFGVDFNAPGTVKEAKHLKLKKPELSFFSWLAKELKNYDLEKKLEITRREGGKKIFLHSPVGEE